MFQETNDKHKELLGFVAEMNELIDKGILRIASDFSLWLEDVEDECVHCYREITEIVNIYIRNL